MSTALSVLSFGESPTCSFIAWRLSELGATITLVDTIYIANDKRVYWKSSKFSSNSYLPFATYSKDNFKNLKEKIDLVLLNANNHDLFEEYTKGLSTILNDKTIILIDSTFASSLEDLVLKHIPNGIVMSIISEVSLEILPIGTSFSYNHIGEKVGLAIGFSSAAKNTAIEQTLKGKGVHGKKLYSIIESLKTVGIHPLNIVIIGQTPSINSHCWRSVLPFIVFDVLSLIYGPLSVNDPIKAPIITGVFIEVLALAFKICGSEFPDPNDNIKPNALFKQLVTDYKQNHAHFNIKRESGTKTVDSSGCLNEPSAIHAVKNNHKNYISLCLKQAINLGKSNNVETPMLISIYSFYCTLTSNDDKRFNGSSNFSTEIVTLESQPVPLRVSANSSFASLRSDRQNSQKMITPDTLGHLYSNASSMASISAAEKPTWKISDGEAVFGQGLNHSRFNHLPQNLPNGMSIGYNSIKTSVYKNVGNRFEGTDLEQAHAFIYRHVNLNNTFEEVNNRFGTVDSLPFFKESRINTCSEKDPSVSTSIKTKVFDQKQLSKKPLKDYNEGKGVGGGNKDRDYDACEASINNILGL